MMTYDASEPQPEPHGYRTLGYHEWTALYRPLRSNGELVRIYDHLQITDDLIELRKPGRRSRPATARTGSSRRDITT